MRIRWFALCALAALVDTGAEAAPPGGGGTGGGTIYFSRSGSLWSMNSDGSGKAALPAGVSGEPSRALHGGQRWLLEQRSITGQTYPDGAVRVELFAVRGDGNAAFTKQLTDQADLQVLRGAWTPGDAAVSWVARRWSGGDVVEGGIYRAAIVFDGSGNVTGLAAQPAAPAVSVELLLDPDTGALKPYLNGHDWSPDGTRAVFGKDRNAAGQWTYELWIADVPGGKSFLVAGSWPQWSPDGSRIAYNSSGGVSTVSPDGTGAKLIVGNTAKSRIYFPHWSPTGSHVAYNRSTGSVLNGTFNSDVYRTTAQGGSKTNLTPEISSADLVAWR